MASIQRQWRDLTTAGDRGDQVACGLIASSSKHDLNPFSATLFHTLAKPGSDNSQTLGAQGLRLVGGLPNELWPGMRVVLHGLQRRADLNGVQGIFDRFLAQSKRCAVRLTRPTNTGYASEDPSSQTETLS